MPSTVISWKKSSSSLLLFCSTPAIFKLFSEWRQQYRGTHGTVTSLCPWTFWPVGDTTERWSDFYTLYFGYFENFGYSIFRLFWKFVTNQTRQSFPKTQAFIICFLTRGVIVPLRRIQRIKLPVTEWLNIPGSVERYYGTTVVPQYH